MNDEQPTETGATVEEVKEALEDQYKRGNGK
jgi:hypothetical protein